MAALILAAPLASAQTTRTSREERARKLFSLPDTAKASPRTVAPLVTAAPTPNSHVVFGIAAPFPQTIGRSEVMPTVVNPLAGQSLPMTKEQYLRKP